MNGKPNNKKVGVIVMAVAAIEASWPQMCRTLFAHFCPFRTSLSPDGTRIAYTGFCDQFDEMPDTGIPPRYTMSCSQSNGVIQKVEFIKLPIETPISQEINRP